MENKDSITEVLDFWFAGRDRDPIECEQQNALWYGFDQDIDEQIKNRFGTITERASIDLLTSWADEPRGALALVIVLDQFSRHVYRGTARAFMQDSLARAITFRSLSNNFHHDLSIPGQLFLFHPLQHSEILSDQDVGVNLLTELLTTCEQDWSDYVQKTLRFFQSHQDVITRFGRFPHRNKILRRPSTPEELEYLKTSSSYGQ